MTDRELMQQALEALVLAQKDAQIAEADYAITALRERLAQPEQEPVAWTPQVWWQFRPDGTLEFQKIKRTPNGAWEDYTTPPRREWVGLTEEEMAELWENRGWYVTIFKAVEAKLKEKNSAN